MNQSQLQELKPRKNQRLIDTVEAVGISTSGWYDTKGDTPAASNPNYCFEWFFHENGLVLLNLWHETLSEENGKIVCSDNLRDLSAREKGHRKRRALEFDEIIRFSFENDIELFANLQICKKGDYSTADYRELDEKKWFVEHYDYKTGKFKLARGDIRSPETNDSLTTDYEHEIEGREGETSSKFTKHRRREGKLRAAKIRQALKDNDDRLLCEVPGCGFDFLETYGELGREYAHVHHLVPLSEAPPEGAIKTLDELAIVCANCHAMIHRGGKCRRLDEVAPVTK